jgi:pimeloyl-ACP methyl ester carboxylesterase
VERAAEHHGCEITYAVRGAGPTVLFVLGVGVHGDGWLPQIEEVTAGHMCLTFDNRGMGRSLPSGTPVTVEQTAEDARAVLNAELIGSTPEVGQSLADLVALQVALSFRDRVRSLSLLRTFPSGWAAAPLTLRMIWLGLRSRVGARRKRRRSFLRLVLPAGQDPRKAGLADRLAVLFGHDLADQTPIIRGQPRAMRAANLEGRLSELAVVPTQVVSARHDPIAPPRAGRRLQNGIPGPRYVKAADASHDLPGPRSGT